MNFILTFSFIVINFYYTSGDKCLAGWDTYDDQLKCIKIIDDSFDTYGNAVDMCAKLAPGSTLLTIHSQLEQDHFTDYLYVQHKLVDSIWLGAKVKQTIMTWMDNTNVTYSNWATGRPQNISDVECVEMQSEPTSLGKWLDIACNKRNQVVCQSMQSMPVSDLEKLILETRKYAQDQIKLLKDENSRQQDELDKLKSNPVPAGFIYTQLAGQPEPSELWPGVKWQDVTSDYSGLFFRAEGSGSEPFGQIQAANWSRLAAVNTHKWAISDPTDTVYEFTNLENIGWSDDIINGNFPNEMYLYFTSTDNRPRNQAIRLFKRI
ncbi:macrophage mannose receptor 1-like [Oppia nitens]|uniref:macrophage mannose receptor 1-like n=1 Tax=Oppia nitens TaxID=1686743 RepID=UPI0023DC7F39|nr:macrophage mannose receptor 1-like [Oppia nitens]